MEKSMVLTRKGDHHKQSQSQEKDQQSREGGKPTTGRTCLTNNNKIPFSYSFSLGLIAHNHV
jgi:hypothetical protein